MPRPATYLLLTLLIACAAGPEAAAQSTSSKQNDDFKACELLTSAEIKSAAGWAPDTAIDKTHGTTKTCAYHGPDALKQSIVLIVARPAPKVSSSAELAERRTRDAARTPEIKITYTPVEGLNMPVVRTDVEGSSTPTLEAIVGNRVLSVTAPEFETAKVLAPKAAARLR